MFFPGVHIDEDDYILKPDKLDEEVLNIAKEYGARINNIFDISDRYSDLTQTVIGVLENKTSNTNTEDYSDKC